MSRKMAKWDIQPCYLTNTNMPQAFHAYTKPMQDGRRKIPPSLHSQIRQDYADLKSQRAVAKKYNVSRRLIVFILYPERYKEFQGQRYSLKVWLKYYDKKAHGKAIQLYRAKKRKYNLQYNPEKICKNVDGARKK